MFGKYQILKIDQFLSEHAGYQDEIIDYVRDRREQLVCQYSYRKICDIEDAMHEKDEMAARKAVDKISKKEIFEVCARVSFLSGLITLYEWLENYPAYYWPTPIIEKAREMIENE